MTMLMSAFIEIFRCERAIKDDGNNNDVRLHMLLFDTEKYCKDATISVWMLKFKLLNNNRNLLN
jgi:hypothetical protein